MLEEVDGMCTKYESFDRIMTILKTTSDVDRAVKFRNVQVWCATIVQRQQDH